MPEVNLLKSYPSGKGSRYPRTYTLEERLEAKKFGHDFFDGTRNQGYGGYTYDGRWEPVARDMIAHYGLPANARILDIGCAKGFLVYEFQKLLSHGHVLGCDVSRYAIENSKPEIRDQLFVADAAALPPFKDKEFDLVLSINTIHNLPYDLCLKVTREIERIGKHAYIQVDAWHNEGQRESFRAWQLTGGYSDEDGTWIPFGTALSTIGWEKFFGIAGYTGEYYWTIIDDFVVNK